MCVRNLHRCLETPRNNRSFRPAIRIANISIRSCIAAFRGCARRAPAVISAARTRAARSLARYRRRCTSRRCRTRHGHSRSRRRWRSCPHPRARRASFVAGGRVHDRVCFVDRHARPHRGAVFGIFAGPLAPELGARVAIERLHRPVTPSLRSVHATAACRCRRRSRTSRLRSSRTRDRRRPRASRFRSCSSLRRAHRSHRAALRSRRLLCSPRAAALPAGPREPRHDSTLGLLCGL